MSSRAMVVVPISFAIFLFGGMSKTWKLFSIPLIGFATYGALALSLYLRSLSSHGLITYLKSLLDFRFTNDQFFDTFQNFVVAFDLNGLAAFMLPKFPLGDLFIQLSPLLGEKAGWYRIANSHRFNISTPYSALGELMNYGFFWLVIIQILAGAVFELLSRRILFFSNSAQSFLFPVLYVGAIYFGALCLQYNLRSAVRILYYLVVLVLFTDLLTSYRRRVNLSSNS
jgi:hypothetical protein